MNEEEIENCKLEIEQLIERNLKKRYSPKIVRSALEEMRPSVPDFDSVEPYLYGWLCALCAVFGEPVDSGEPLFDGEPSDYHAIPIPPDKREEFERISLHASLSAQRSIEQGHGLSFIWNRDPMFPTSMEPIPDDLIEWQKRRKEMIESGFLGEE